MGKLIHTFLCLGLLAGCTWHMNPPSKGEIAVVDEGPVDMDLKSAERNFMLGESHYQHATPAEDILAVRYFMAAAEQGNTDAEARLGQMLLAGRGIEANPTAAAQWLRRAAKEGVVDAQTALGALYAHGIGVPVDLKEAEKWYLLAAGHQDVAAMLGLVRMYRLQPGDGTAQKEAFQWANEAAKHHSPEGQYWVGEFYSTGVGTARDLQAAQTYYEQAAQAGYSDAYLALATLYAEGTMMEDPTHPWFSQIQVLEEGSAAVELAMRYELGDGVQRDLSQAMRLYQEAAAKGYPYAAYRVGRLYEQQGQKGRLTALPWLETAASRGVVAANVDLAQLWMAMPNPDWQKVQHYFQLAAEQGNPFSQYMLSIFYRFPPHGLKEDLSKSVFWYQKAEGLSGQAYAQYEIGQCYAKGIGFSKNMEEAFRWYLAAAERGVVEAQVMLGNLYFAGQGVDYDPLEAGNWYKRAVAGGSVAAKYYLGLMYLEGQGVPGPDPKTAALWLNLAAKEQFAPAQFRLAEMYFEGVGVPQSDVQAYAWWSLSAAGHYEARFAALETLIQRMTPHELKKAVTLAEKYAAEYTPPTLP